MADLQKIHALIARARRRLRLMAALDAAVTAAIAGVAAALVVLWLGRMELISRGAALGALIAIAAGVLLAGLYAGARRLPVRLVASRIDRASGLADRLGTACDFGERLGEKHHPETRAFMDAAIADGIAAVPRADVKAATRFRLPRDLRALGAFVAVAVLVGLLGFGPRRPVLAPLLAGRPAARTAQPTIETLDRDDLDYQREFVGDMKQLAEQTSDRALTEMARQLDDLLDKAEKGEIGKQELIARMEALEKKYSAGGAEDLDAVLRDLAEQGKQLEKQPVTKKLGEALEKGDLDQARQELEKLADQIDKGEMKPDEQKKLADALDKAAEQQEQKQQRQDRKDQQEQKQAREQIAEKQEEIRRLQKKLEQRPEDEEARRTLQKEKRELDRLEREQQQPDKPKRQLDRLTRDMKRAAESLRQKNQQQSAKDVREAAGESQKVQDELRRMANQKKVQSQLNDLKEAIRRARPRKGSGQSGSEQARMRRIQEWEQRAGGERGDQRAWQPQPGGKGDQDSGKEQQLTKQDKPSSQWGTAHDPDLTGDPTGHFGKTKDERLTGIQGKGPSRRETILTSARKGFAQTGYRNVYVDYKKVAEEVMRQEKVPQGYKYYVKRYFQRIKPHSMDDDRRPPE